MADEIHIVNGVVAKPGDTLVIHTKESLSREVIMSMRGNLMAYFQDKDVDVVIIAADQVILLSPSLEEELNCDDDA